MKEVNLVIIKNELIGLDTYQMELAGDLSEIKHPGEFVEIKLDGYYLRRPISVSNWTTDSLTLVYKVLGLGTKDLSHYERGKTLSVLIGLGNGFDLQKSKRPLLIGGGIGIAPLIGLAYKFNELGIKPTILYGVKTQEELVLISQLEKISNLIITTDDGSYGYHGNTVKYLKENNIDYDYYYACGPKVMLKYLQEASTNGFMSLEERMGCGFGACMGCTIKTTNGYKRVCKEGPVFLASEVIFE